MPPRYTKVDGGNYYDPENAALRKYFNELADHGSAATDVGIYGHYLYRGAIGWNPQDPESESAGDHTHGLFFRNPAKYGRILKDSFKMDVNAAAKRVMLADIHGWYRPVFDNGDGIWMYGSAPIAQPLDMHGRCFNVLQYGGNVRTLADNFGFWLINNKVLNNLEFKFRSVNGSLKNVYQGTQFGREYFWVIEEYANNF